MVNKVVRNPGTDTKSIRAKSATPGQQTKAFRKPVQIRAITPRRPEASEHSTREYGRIEPNWVNLGHQTKFRRPDYKIMPDGPTRE